MSTNALIIMVTSNAGKAVLVNKDGDENLQQNLINNFVGKSSMLNKLFQYGEIDYIDNKNVEYTSNKSQKISFLNKRKLDVILHDNSNVEYIHIIHDKNVYTYDMQHELISDVKAKIIEFL